jgi:hypothetical protein
MLTNYILFTQPDQIALHLPSDKATCKLLKSEAAIHFKTQRQKTGFLCAIQIKQGEGSSTNICVITCPKCNHIFDTSYAKELDPEYAHEISAIIFYCKSIPTLKPLIDALAKDWKSPSQDKIEVVINAISSNLYIHSKRSNLSTSVPLLNSLNSSAQECFAPQRLNTVNNNVMKCSILSSTPNTASDQTRVVTIQTNIMNRQNMPGIHLGYTKTPEKKNPAKTPAKSYTWNWYSEEKPSHSFLQAYDQARKTVQLQFSKHIARK